MTTTYNNRTEPRGETIEQNNAQTLDNQKLINCREITYEEFSEEEKCCDLQCYTPEKNFNCCCGCKKIIDYFISPSIIQIISYIGFLILFFNIKPKLKKLKNENMRELEDLGVDNINDLIEIDLEKADIYPKYKLWYNICIFTFYDSIISIIIFILFLIFIFIQKCKYYEVITQKEKKQGKITSIIIIIIIIFYILFYIITFLSLFKLIFYFFMFFSIKNMEVFDLEYFLLMF